MYTYIIYMVCEQFPVWNIVDECISRPVMRPFWGGKNISTSNKILNNTVCAGDTQGDSDNEGVRERKIRNSDFLYKKKKNYTYMTRIAHMYE